MGYKVLNVQKKLLDFHIAPPSKDIVMFIRITADLLKEKLSYNEILTLLLSDMENKTLKETIREVNQDLKDGKEGREVFGKQQDVLGKFPSYIKKWQTFALPDEDRGFKGLNIVMVEKGNADEGLIAISKVIAPFWKIEGFAMKVDTLLSMRDAIKVLGKSL